VGDHHCLATKPLKNATVFQRSRYDLIPSLSRRSRAIWIALAINGWHTYIEAESSKLKAESGKGRARGELIADFCFLTL
jgi:hypothetical protein